MINIFRKLNKEGSLLNQSPAEGDRIQQLLLAVDIFPQLRVKSRARNTYE